MSVVHRERSYWSCYGLWSLQETTILTLVEGTTLGAILWPMAYMNTNYTHHNNYMVNGYDCWCMFIWWSPLYRGKHQNIYYLWHFYVWWSSILPLMATILISIQNNMQQFDLIYLWIDCVSVSKVQRWLVTMGQKF